MCIRDRVCLEWHGRKHRRWVTGVGFDRAGRVGHRVPYRVGFVIGLGIGDMLLTPDPDTHKLTVRTEFGGSDALFLPRPVIHLTERTDRAREYAQDLHSVIMRYRWAGRMHGRALAGWLVSSLIGGALDHRPALWLLADRDTGKTYLLERIIGAMMDDCITSLADTSEAGLAAMVGADSMPVYIDEFESEDSREHTWSALLKLLRISTGGKGVRARGTPGGEYTLSHPRFSLLVASTRQPDLKPTDHSRILTISLAKRGVADWPVLREDIKRATSYDRMLAVRTAIIEQSGVLADKVRSLEMRMIARGENTSSREAQITAALTVGDGWLAGLERPEEATPVRRDLDDSMTDEHDLLSALLSAEVRTEKGATTTISNTLRRGWWASKGTGEMVFSPYAGLEYYQELAKHHGLMMTQDGGLAVACNYPPLSALLAHTQHAHTSIEKYLANLPGVTRYATESGKRARIRFGAGGLLRGALIVPNELLADVGACVEELDNEQTEGTARVARDCRHGRKHRRWVAGVGVDRARGVGHRFPNGMGIRYRPGHRLGRPCRRASGVLRELGMMRVDDAVDTMMLYVLSFGLAANVACMAWCVVTITGWAWVPDAALGSVAMACAWMAWWFDNG